MNDLFQRRSLRFRYYCTSILNIDTGAITELSERFDLTSWKYYTVKGMIAIASVEYKPVYPMVNHWVAHTVACYILLQRYIYPRIPIPKEGDHTTASIVPVLYLEKGSCPEIDDTLPTSTSIWLYDESDPSQILPIDYIINIVYREMIQLAEMYHL